LIDYIHLHTEQIGLMMSGDEEAFGQVMAGIASLMAESLDPGNEYGL
jgi:hypothetical protein